MYITNIAKSPMQASPFNPSRRAVLLGALSGAFVRPARSETVVLQVVTSFPEELTTRYEQEFEKLNPGAHVQFVWKQSRDALELLSRERQGGADVYWAPSLGNFPILRDAGALRKLTVDRPALPGKLGQTQISDPAGFYEAYDVAGYGVAINPGLAKERGLAAPRAWRDLAAPGFEGQLVIPSAGRIGFAPALYDIILQSEGWEQGWGLIFELAGNAEIAGSGSAPTAAVKDGKAPFALTIDFLALQARANGLPVDFVYPERTAFLPGHIAIAAATQHYELAQKFVDFALSRAGQRLLMETDSSRHPARPDAYEGRPPGILDPFALPQSATFDYDADIGRRRPGLLIALFEIAVGEPHKELSALWRGVHAAERKALSAAARAAVEEARRLAGAIPVSARDGADPAFLERFSNRDAIDPALKRKWREELDAARSNAAALLAKAGGFP